MKNLLLLHGALSTEQQFETFAPMLAKHYHIHTITFRGHGKNTTPLSGHFFDDYLEDMLTYMNTNKLTDVNILGYSMGGYAALYFASKHPSLVHKIMTLNTKFDWNKEQLAKEIALLNADKIAEKVPAYAMALMQLHGETNWKTVLLNTKTMMEQLADTPLLTHEILCTIAHEVIIGVGDRDNTASVKENLTVQQTLPNAGLLVLPNTPHPFDKVNVELLATHCIQFMG